MVAEVNDQQQQQQQSINEIISVYKVNEVFMGIETNDAGIKMEIREHFSFLIPGAKFHPKVKNKLWDGRINLYDIRLSRLPIGLFLDLVKFCDERQYTLRFIDHEHKTNQKYYGSLKDTVTPEELSDDDIRILDSIPFVYDELRDYQMKAIVHCISSKRGIILSPTGSGKSAKIYYLSLWNLQKNKRPVLIIVPTTSLVSQMKKDFHNYSKKSLPDGFIHQIYSGQEKENINFEKSPIVVSTWQSIMALGRGQAKKAGSKTNLKRMKEFLDNFGMIINDEVHTADAASLVKILENATESKYRFGFTGTLKDSKTSEFQLRGLFGNIYQTITTHELQERKELANLSIECVFLKYPESIRKQFNKGKHRDYQREIDFILSSEKRNEYIAKAALSQKDNTMVLFQYVEKHGKKLFEMIEKLNGDPKRRIFFISGSSSVHQREEMREIVESEKNAIIVGSNQVLSTGINIVNLNTIIFAWSTKSQVRVIQSIGRALRVSENKKEAKLIDVIDNISWKSKKNYVLKHGIQRMEYYIEQKFKYKMQEIQFDPGVTIDTILTTTTTKSS